MLAVGKSYRSSLGPFLLRKREVVGPDLEPLVAFDINANIVGTEFTPPDRIDFLGLPEVVAAFWYADTRGSGQGGLNPIADATLGHSVLVMLTKDVISAQVLNARVRTYLGWPCMLEGNSAGSYARGLYYVHGSSFHFGGTYNTLNAVGVSPDLSDPGPLVVVSFRATQGGTVSTNLPSDLAGSLTNVLPLIFPSLAYVVTWRNNIDSDGFLQDTGNTAPSFPANRGPGFYRGEGDDSATLSDATTRVVDSPPRVILTGEVAGVDFTLANLDDEIVVEGLAFDIIGATESAPHTWSLRIERQGTLN